MSNIFISNIKDLYYKPLDSNLHKDWNFVSIECKEKENALHKSDSDEYKNTIFYSSSKEWNNSVYSYNKSYVKSLIGLYTSVKDLFTSYFNMAEEKIKRIFKRRRTNKMRYSANRIYVGSPELKHTNNKISIILYMYNKQKLSFEQDLTKLVGKKKYILKKRLANLKKNKVVILLNKYFVLFYKVKYAFFFYDHLINLNPNIVKNLEWEDVKELNAHLINLKRVKNLEWEDVKELNDNLIYLNTVKNSEWEDVKVKNLEWEDVKELNAHLINLKIVKNLEWEDVKELNLKWKNVMLYMTAVRWIYLKKCYKLEEKISNIKKTMNFNKLKHNDLLFYRDDSGLRSLLQKIFNKKIDIHMVELKSIHLNSDVFSSAVALKLRDRNNKAVRVLRDAILQKVSIPDLHTIRTFDDFIEKIDENNIIDVIKQQVVTGIRFEASGRLTKRLTAMRAVFKYRYIGSLKNLRSSLNGDSSSILRGCMKANGQLTMIESKTRNGAFGLKCWISSH